MSNIEQGQIITITDLAINQMRNIINEYRQKNVVGGVGIKSYTGVRIGVIGGGCSGLSYKIDFGEQKEKDYILHFDDFDVYIDPKSAIYIKETILDFEGGLNGKGFVFNNPGAKNTCGCGESFSV